MSERVITFLLAAIPAIIAITLHEAAHGYAAWALGDQTAKRLGRLSLNPLVHIDRVGTLILPGFLLISQLITLGRVEYMFGWAKPVPVDAQRFADPRRGMMLVAAAGPLMNFVLAWLGGLALHLVFWLPHAQGLLAVTALINFIATNLVLALFNLLPIPPLDGGRIVVGLLPEALALRWARLERVGMLLVLLGVFIVPAIARGLDLEFDPVHEALLSAISVGYDAVLFLSGHAGDR
jgi:Zn-dependent protease